MFLCNHFYFVLFSRQRTELTAENLKHLEKVFRDTLAKDKDEFTLAEFKKLVPSKNVSAKKSVNCSNADKKIYVYIHSYHAFKFDKAC